MSTSTSLANMSDTEQKLAARIDNAITQNIELSADAGGMRFVNAVQVMEFAKMMAVSGAGVRKHLRGNPGVCLAITIQAIEWRMSPYAVANKSFLVNDQISFESQLIQAVILQRAPIKGRFRYHYSGEGTKRKLRIEATTTDGDIVDYETPEIGKIPVQNSPLWKADPDQQLGYYGGRALCRRHFPDVILGVYSQDEAEMMAAQPEPRIADKSTGLADRMAALAAPAATARQPDVSDVGEDESTDHAAASSVTGAGEDSPPSDASSAPTNFEEIDRLGYDAAMNGAAREAVPRKLSNLEKAAWLRGYDRADAEANEGGEG